MTHHSISLASVGQFKSVYALLTITLGLLIAGSASATSMSYDIDAQFSSPPYQSITGQGSFTADDETGVISAFEWAAISSYGFDAFDLGDLYSGFATFDASGDLTGFSVFGISGDTSLQLGLGTGDGGLFAEMSNATGMLVMGVYTIHDAETGTQVLGAVSASPMPEPSAAVLYGAGLLIANGTLRRRRQS